MNIFVLTYKLYENERINKLKQFQPPYLFRDPSNFTNIHNTPMTKDIVDQIYNRGEKSSDIWTCTDWSYSNSFDSQFQDNYLKNIHTIRRRTWSKKYYEKELFKNDIFMYTIKKKSSIKIPIGLNKSNLYSDNVIISNNNLLPNKILRIQ